MSIHAVIFYLLAAVIIGCTAVAVTRRNLIHAVLYLVVSFFGSAMLFYLLGAPLLAALEVIIYAGAIMILFLFIIMMLNVESKREQVAPLKQYVPAMVVCLFYLSVILTLFFAAPAADSVPMQTASAEPGVFGHFLFRTHWLSIEAVSLLLLVALVGALQIGLRRKNADEGGGS